MEGKKQRKITKREQKTAVEILSYFFYVSNMKEVMMRRYGHCDGLD